MVVQLDPCVTEEYHPMVQEALQSTGIPGKVEISEKQLEIVTPVYADPQAIEILRPVVESILKRIVDQIKLKHR